MMGFGSNGYFVIGVLCLNLGHGYNFASSVGHPRSDSVELLDMMVCAEVEGGGRVERGQMPPNSPPKKSPYPWYNFFLCPRNASLQQFIKEQPYPPFAVVFLFNIDVSHFCN
jgi:hypothetical protein